MGRQIAIAASAADEEAFLKWLSESTDIQLLRSHVPSEQDLWVDHFLPFKAEDHYYLWNKKYAWNPNVCTTDDGAEFYVQNTDQGPVLEFRRTNVDRFLASPLTATGRIYWGAYNKQKGFITWFDKVLRRIRKTGTPLKVYSSTVYCQPDLWQQLQTRQHGVTGWDGQWKGSRK